MRRTALFWVDESSACCGKVCTEKLSQIFRYHVAAMSGERPLKMCESQSHAFLLSVLLFDSTQGVGCSSSFKMSPRHSLAQESAGSNHKGVTACLSCNEGFLLPSFQCLQKSKGKGLCSDLICNVLVYLDIFVNF